MPVETIKCRECGSAEVTEFKAGSYVCGHCDAVFKHSSATASAGGCEIDGCGVPAVGRCSSCNLRFCKTHQVRDRVFRWPAGWDEFGRPDLCTSCLAVQKAQARQQEVDAEHEAQETIRRTLAGIADPYERLVVAVCMFAEDRAARFIDSAASGALLNELVGDVCPEPPTWRFAFANGPTWDGQAIARWFASRAQARGLSPDTTVSVWKRKKVWFGSKIPKEPWHKGPPEPAWEFRGGSTLNPEDPVLGAFVLADGRLRHGHWGGDEGGWVDRDYLDGEYNLTGRALRRMASLLQLPGAQESTND